PTKADVPEPADANTTSVNAAKRADTPSSASSTGAPELHTNTGATAALALWQNPSIPFPDGTIDCSAFPADQQGVVAVDYLGFGGWSGIQYADDSTAISGMTCTEGAYCSYACQPGMSKTQWPTVQPSDGQSRGGLLCKAGKLYLTNPASQYLCLWGTSADDLGNWAPVNFGAGHTGGTAWLSIMYNPLQTSSKLDYNVKIECVSGTMNGECVYENGVIKQGGNGCTVSCNGVCHF